MKKFEWKFGGGENSNSFIPTKIKRAYGGILILLCFLERLLLLYTALPSVEIILYYDTVCHH